MLGECTFLLREENMGERSEGFDDVIPNFYIFSGV